MKMTLDSIQAESIHLPPRILLLGVEKIGKSTFASQAPSPIFIPIKREEGISALPVAKFPVAKTYNELMEALHTLWIEPHDFKTIVIDSASALEPLIWEFCCEKNNWAGITSPGFGNGYTEALKQWGDICESLSAFQSEKKIGSIIIGHVGVKTFNDPTADPYDTYKFDVQEKAGAMLQRWADCILFANRKVISKSIEGGFGKKTTHAIGKDEPLLFTRKRPAHSGGGRDVYGQLPYEIPLSWAAFEKAVADVRGKSAA